MLPPSGIMSLFLRPLCVAAVLLAPTLAFAADPPAVAESAAVAVTPPAAEPIAPWTFRPTPTPDIPIMRRRNSNLMIGGLVTTSLGIVSLLGGALLIHDADTRPSSCPDPQNVTSAGQAFGCAIGDGLGRMPAVLGGWTFAISGGLMIAGGTTMALLGGWKVPVNAGARATAIPTLSVGPTSASARWTF